MTKKYIDELYTNKAEGNDDLLLEQYKLYIQDAQKTSDRRSSTNNFLLTAITLLFAAISLLFENNAILALVLLDIIGFVVCIGWVFQLNYYKRLNSAKFKVINSLEEKLAVKGFTVEWKIFKDQRFSGIVASRLELALPIILGISFIIFFFYHLLS